jgi:hypothetical protein
MSFYHILRIQPMKPTRDGRNINWHLGHIGMSGPSHFLQISSRQAQRLLGAEKLPPADVNLSGSFKGHRQKISVLAHFYHTRKS